MNIIYMKIITYTNIVDSIVQQRTQTQNNPIHFRILDVLFYIEKII